MLSLQPVRAILGSVETSFAFMAVARTNPHPHPPSPPQKSDTPTRTHKYTQPPKNSLSCGESDQPPHTAPQTASGSSPRHHLRMAAMASTAATSPPASPLHTAYGAVAGSCSTLSF